ncbi:MAG: aldolase/citrate lyase family protein, partial [Burkholderiaceae bacterium]
MNNPFKTMLARKDLPAGYPVGTFAMGASPLIAEALGHAGFDWAVVDMEHTPLDLADLVHMLQAMAGTPMQPVTRVPWNDTVMVKRVLDAGAQTLMFPFVQTVEEARKAVAACKYPPQGVRGMAAISRGSRFGTVK